MRQSDLRYLSETEFNIVLRDLMASKDQDSKYFIRSLSDLRDDKLLYPPIEVLGFAAEKLLSQVPSRRLAIDLSSPAPKMSPAARWGVGLIKAFLTELREILCGPKSKWNKLDEKTTGSLASVAAMIGSYFGLPGALASGIATWILIALARAAKKSICEMTDEEVLKALADEQ